MKNILAFSTISEHWDGLVSLNPSLMQDKDPPISHSQYHDSWCPGNARSQGISTHCIKLFQTILAIVSEGLNSIHDHPIQCLGVGLWTYWLSGARLQYLQCVSKGDTAVLHWVIDMSVLVFCVTCIRPYRNHMLELCGVASLRPQYFSSHNWWKLIFL